MARLKPSTRKAVENVAARLLTIADDIEPARPFLATLYRLLAEELEGSLCVPDSPFRLHIPEGSNASISEAGGWVTINPPNFNPVKYYERLRKG